MDMKKDNHLITNILRQIENKDFEQLTYDAYEANLHCYECLIVKSSPQTYHCKECNVCIDYHHKHSAFFGKCIGRNNAIAYFWFLFTNVVLNIAFVYSFINIINRRNALVPDAKDLATTTPTPEVPTDSDEQTEAGTDQSEDPIVAQVPSNFLLAIVGCFVTIFKENLILLGGTFFLTVFLAFNNLEKLMEMSHAIANRGTMREFKDVWMHPHLFVAERDDGMDPVARVRQEVEMLQSSRTDSQRQ